MLTPQEVSVWYILPALRREITLVLKEKGVKQKQIAGILGVTEPAVSQYLQSKRAKQIMFPTEITDEICHAVNRMSADMTCHRYHIQDLLEKVKKSGFLCDVHRKFDDVPDCCNVCLEGSQKCKST